MKPPKLLNVDEVQAYYAEQPKLIESWIMVGYRRWYKAKYEAQPITSKERAIDEKLKGLDGIEYLKLKNEVRAKLKK